MATRPRPAPPHTHQPLSQPTGPRLKPQARVCSGEPRRGSTAPAASRPPFCASPHRSTCLGGRESETERAGSTARQGPVCPLLCAYSRLYSPQKCVFLQVLRIAGRRFDWVRPLRAEARTHWGNCQFPQSYRFAPKPNGMGLGMQIRTECDVLTRKRTHRLQTKPKTPETNRLGPRGARRRAPGPGRTAHRPPRTTPRRPTSVHGTGTPPPRPLPPLGAGPAAPLRPPHPTCGPTAPGTGARPSAPGRGDRAVRRLSRGAAMSLGSWRRGVDAGAGRPSALAVVGGGRGESARVAAPLASAVQRPAGRGAGGEARR